MKRCVVCGKEMHERASGETCGNASCYYEQRCREQWAKLQQVLGQAMNKKLTGFSLSTDGAKAILYFEGDKVAVLGASGNLWDEAYPYYADNMGNVDVWGERK